MSAAYFVFDSHRALRSFLLAGSVVVVVVVSWISLFDLSILGFADGRE